MTLCDVYCDVSGISLQSHYVGVLDMYETLNQSMSEVIINQSNYVITFDT